VNITVSQAPKDAGDQKGNFTYNRRIEQKEKARLCFKVM
jgi:hypothetical protein